MKFKKHLLPLLLSGLLCIPFTAPVLADEAPAAEGISLTEGTYVPGEVIVLFRSDKNPNESTEPLLLASGDEAQIADTVAENLDGGFDVAGTYVFPEVDDSSGAASEGRLLEGDYSDDDLTVSLIRSDTYSTEEMMSMLSKNEKVAAVQPNSYIYYEDFEPYELNDEYADYLFHVNSPEAQNLTGKSVVWRDPAAFEGGTAISDNASLGWKKLTGNEEEAVVAVIDTGINPNHEDLKNRLWVNDPEKTGLPGVHGYNFADGNTDVTDHNGHGTHCAGIIAAQADNGIGVAGAAGKANVKIMALNMNGGGGEESNLFVATGAFNYVLKAKAAGVNVVATSNSWGRADTVSYVFDAIIDRLGEAGIVSFFASGNSAKNLDSSVDNPASNTSKYSVTVGSGKLTGEPSGYSNYGQAAVDIFAPGTNILSTVGYACYFPTLYDAEKLKETTEYYGIFTPDTVSGTADPSETDIIPETGIGGSAVNAFGPLVFREQASPNASGNDPVSDEESQSEPDAAEVPEEETPASADEYSFSEEPAPAVEAEYSFSEEETPAIEAEYSFSEEETPAVEAEYSFSEEEAPGSIEEMSADKTEDSASVPANENSGAGRAACEVSIDTDHYIRTGDDHASLKVTIKNAHFDSNYFVYFPYKKNPLTDGEHNTQYSITYKSGDNSLEGDCIILGGEISEDKNGDCTLTNYGALGHNLDNWNKYLDTHLRGSETPDSTKTKLLTFDEASDKKAVGIGLYISPSPEKGGWPTQGEEAHDLTFYIDSVAVSKPTAEIDADEAYDIMSGTSMACPAAAGAGALLAVLNPRQANESGADYAIRLRNKVLSCARQSDALEGLCSTGGYIDLSLMDRPAPAITDAVCDLEKKTVTLYGTGFSPDCTVTYQRLKLEGAEETALPSGTMGLEISESGDTIVISNAEELFGTLTKFRIRGAYTSSEASFYLVNGHTVLPLAAQKLFSNPAEEDYVPESLFHIFTDAEGRTLYSMDPETGVISGFDGSQFVPLAGTAVKEAYKSVLREEGFNDYDISNNFSMNINRAETELVDGNMLYLPVSVNISSIGDEEPEYRSLTAYIDLSEKQPGWKFKDYTPPVDAGWNNYSFCYKIMNGTMYALGCAAGKLENNILLSYDLTAEKGEWTELPSLPAQIYSPLFTSYKGKLYVMFGAGISTTFIKDPESLLSDAVWCFDGKDWQKTGSLKYGGKYDTESSWSLYYPRVCAPAANGLVFIDTFVDGLGNTFLYDPETDTATPFRYTISGTNSDYPFSRSNSCAATREGIWYVRDISNELNRGWGLWFLSADTGLYENYYAHEHTLKRTAAKAATLKKNGNIAYWTCSSCGQMFADKAASKPVNKKDVVVAYPKTIKLKTASYTYNGKAKKPAVTVKDANGKTIAASNYSVTYANNTNAGNARAEITFKGNYSGTKTLPFTIKKAANTLKLSSASVNVKKSSLTKAKTVNIRPQKAAGKVIYSSSATTQKAGIVVYASGKVVIPKNCKNGTYKITVRAEGNNNYKASSKAFTIRVK